MTVFDLKPFATDGCSGLFMRAVHLYWRLAGQQVLSRSVRVLCVTHDQAYHPGGTALQRIVADAALIVGVATLGRPVLARLMFVGISVGGHWSLPLPWRWGYGLPWPRRYRRS